MKKMFLGICYFMICHWLPAQEIKGRVTDAKDGSPLIAASVGLNNVNFTITDSKGEFVFKDLDSGSYTIRVSYVGYKQLEQTVFPGAGTIELKLQRGLIPGLLLEPIEVRAIRAGDDAPFSKTNINAPEIEKLNTGQDLPMVLNMTPSVVVNSDAGNGVGYTGIRIRGSDGTRINVTLNGIPYNDAESQGSFFVDLPDFLSSANSIQVQRGVGTSSNGGGAFGATINLNTNEINRLAYAEINNSFGSFNTWKHTIRAGSGLIRDHFTLDARLSKISSDGYVDRASTDLKSFYLSGAYLSENTSVRLNVFSGVERTYQSWYGVSEADLSTNRTINYAGTEKPGEPYDDQTDNFQQDHFQLFLNQKLGKRLTANTAFFYTIGKGYYEEYRADEAFADYGLPDFVAGTETFTGTDLVRQLWLDNDFYGQIFNLRYDHNNTRFTLGGGWNRYDGKHYGKVIWAEQGVPLNHRWYDLDAYKTDVNVYGKLEQKINARLDLFADLQYRRVLYDIGGFRDNPGLHVRNTYNFFNPKIGINYRYNGYRLYASYSQGNKEPNRDDFEAGTTQQPRPEKLHDFELGFEKSGSGHHYSATLYYMQYKDQLVLTGKVNDVGAYTRTNVPNSFRTGVELQGYTNITKWLLISGNITLSRNRIKDFTEFYDDYDNGGQKSIEHGSTDIAFSPAVTGAGSLEFSLLRNIDFSLLSKYVGRQYLDNTSNRARSLDPFYVQDIRFIYDLPGWIPGHSKLILQVNNIFDKKYEPNGYTYSYQSGGSLVTENYYYPMAGTNFMVALNLKF